jgi:signal transduction histidine kinase
MRMRATNPPPPALPSAADARMPRSLLLDALSAEDRASLLEQARRVRAEAGTVVFRQGDAADGLYILLEGRLEVTRTERGEELLLGVQRPGDFVGEIALLAGEARSATVTATVPSELIVLAPDGFRELLMSRPDAALAILRTVSARLAATESTLIRHEKLASLGTLAAGLAHELNNPAAAVQRAAAQLRDAIEQTGRLALALAAVPARDVVAADLLDGPPAAPTDAPEPADVAAWSDEEERIASWLAELGVAESQRAAYGILACGWTVDLLRSRLDGLARDAARPILEWFAAYCDALALSESIVTAGGAIAGIVGAVRTHANLDRAPVQPVDIRRSIEAALLVLRSRWKPGVTVTLDLPGELPHVEAHAGELGQVWTNLIGNALDAMRGAGRLRISARVRGRTLAIDLENDGPPIPRSLQPRVFEPFFTTKPPGSGSGLGLHIVRDIIVGRHGGRVAVRSRPGRTVFRVVLPLGCRRRAAHERG